MKRQHCISVLLFILILAGCDPAQRIARIVKRHPELVKTDTIKKEISVAVPPIKIDTSIVLSKDTSALYAVIDLYKNKIDSLTALKLKAAIRIVSIGSKALKDTVTFVQDSLTVKVWEQDGKLQFRINKPITHVKTIVPIVVNKLEVEKALTWKQRYKIWMFGNWWWIVAIIALVIFLFRKVIGGFLSIYFPFLKK